MHVRNMSAPQNYESLEEQHAAAALALLDEQENLINAQHVNVLAHDQNGMMVNIDDIWPTVPDNIEVHSVWEPWGDPNGQYVDWDPSILMPWVLYDPESGSDESQQTQQLGFD